MTRDRKTTKAHTSLRKNAARAAKASATAAPSDVARERDDDWAGLDAANRRRWFFSPRASDDPRFDIAFGLSVIVLFFGGFVGWASSAPLDAAIVAPGAVVVSGYRQSVQHRDGGIVSAIAVREGERVVQGQILVELAATEVVAQEEALASQLIDLQLQSAQIDAEMLGKREIERPQAWIGLTDENRTIAEAAFRRHMDEFAARRQAAGIRGDLDARIAGLRGQITAVDRQSALLEEELAGMRTLAEQQLIPLPTVRQRERALAELQGERSRLTSAIAQVRQDRAEERRRIEAKIAEIAPQHAALQTQMEASRLRAPTSGVVVGLSVNTVGGVVRSGERIMDIVPDEEALVIESRVQPSDGEGLRTGLSAEVRLTAFHGRNLPLMHGVLRTVSADTLTDQRSEQPFYRVEVEVSRKDVEAALKASQGAAGALRPGLPAQVIIPTRPRTVMQYLTEPLMQSLRGALRED